MSAIRKWFFDTKEFCLFVFLAAAGFASSALTFHLLDGYPYNSGKNLAGAFVPPFFSVCYATYAGNKQNFTTAVLCKTLALYLFQLIPLASLFTQTFIPTPEDDFNRYYIYAKNMVERHTLWGGDKLYFPEVGYSYATQPGYRYFIAFELFLFGGLYRFVQFINIALLVTACYLFQKTIKSVIAPKRLQLFVLLITILLTPYATKNGLMGLSEWLTALLLMTACYLYCCRKQVLPAVFILGLLPFFRQNLLIAVVLLAVYIIASHPKKWQLVFAFLLPLLLPLYHNLYYAGEWRFFVKMFATPLLNASKPAGLDFRVLLHNLWRLTGAEYADGRPHFEPLALAFLPLSVVAYTYLIKRFRRPWAKWLYAFTTLAVILPGLFLGKDYYPRFEFVSVVMTLVTYCLLTTPEKRFLFGRRSQPTNAKRNPFSLLFARSAEETS